MPLSLLPLSLLSLSLPAPRPLSRLLSLLPPPLGGLRLRLRPRLRESLLLLRLLRLLLLLLLLLPLLLLLRLLPRSRILGDRERARRPGPESLMLQPRSVAMETSNDPVLLGVSSFRCEIFGGQLIVVI